MQRAGVSSVAALGLQRGPLQRVGGYWFGGTAARCWQTRATEHKASWPLPFLEVSNICEAKLSLGEQSLKEDGYSDPVGRTKKAWSLEPEDLKLSCSAICKHAAVRKPCFSPWVLGIRVVSTCTVRMRKKNRSVCRMMLMSQVTVLLHLEMRHNGELLCFV